MALDPIVIVSQARTPIGSFQGALKDLPAWHLGSIAIQAAFKRSHLDKNDIQQVLMGCVLTAGQGQAPARQAAIRAGLSVATGCTTINKMCGSGMQSVIIGSSLLMSHQAEIVLCGGMESMSNAPYLLDKARSGYRLGHTNCLDHMLLDGLEDAYAKGRLMGCFAEDTVKHYGFTRDQQDQYAITSLQRAQQAITQGCFKEEITPVTLANKTIMDQDETPAKANLDKIPLLKPVFANDGTITAANASSISDGAAALILMRYSHALQRGLQPIATIVGTSFHAHEPRLFTTAPIAAIKKLLTTVGWQKNAVDLYEINEAFAAVTMAAIQDLALDANKVNIHGGAVALGHPIGASGARIIVTLIASLQRYKLKRGIAALCIGGGEATAIAIEII